MACLLTTTVLMSKFIKSFVHKHTCVTISKKNHLDVKVSAPANDSDFKYVGS